MSEQPNCSCERVLDAYRVVLFVAALRQISDTEGSLARTFFSPAHRKAAQQVRWLLPVGWLVGWLGGVVGWLDSLQWQQQRHRKAQMQVATQQAPGPQAAVAAPHAPSDRG